MTALQLLKIESEYHHHGEHYPLPLQPFTLRHLLSKARWSGLQEQVELQARNHSEEENCAARRRRREFLEDGWGAVDWVELYGQK